MPDINRYNLLHKPFLYPERTHRSEATFKGNKPSLPREYFPPEDEDYLKDYKELEDLIPGLPEDLAPLGEIVPFLRIRGEVLDQEKRLRAGIPRKQPIKRVAKKGTIEEPQISIIVKGGETTPVGDISVTGEGSLPGGDISIFSGKITATSGTSTAIPTAQSSDSGTDSTSIGTGTYKIPPPDKNGTKTIRIFVPNNSSEGSSSQSATKITSSILPPDQYVTLVDVVTLPTGIVYEYEVPSYYDDAFDWHRGDLEDIAGSTFSPEENTAVYVGTNITEDIETIDGLPPIIPNQTNIILEVETPKSIVETIQETYVKDQVDLQKRYLENMRAVLQKYFQHQLAALAELNMGDLDLLTKDYDGDNVSVSDGQLKHLHDTIIRSQLQRKQKALYFKKTANTDFTLTHMRVWNAAEKSRERYYAEAYGTSDNFVDSESNAILRQARADYDAAYNNGLYNMLRYLNSSVEITEDILNHVMTESKAKAKLIQSGVNIYAAEEYEYPDDGVSTTQPMTSAQASAAQNSGSNQDSGSGNSKDPATLDKAHGIEDPADEGTWGISPMGCHYSKNDIAYLVSLGGIYNETTTEGRAAIKMALNQNTKYANDNDSDSSNSDSSKDAANSSGQSATEKSDEAVAAVTGSQTSDKDEETTDAKEKSKREKAVEELQNRLAMMGLDEIYTVTSHKKSLGVGGIEYRIHTRYPAESSIIYIHKSSNKGKIWISDEAQGSKSFSEKEIAADEIKQAALQHGKEELSSFNMNIKEEVE